ncbi:hypothetical protein BDY19DRAFT_907898 [Irpex rosettiformis]|uniref:Uncharacterized protein n=1 Tax=Irpex rosettiformis TaxID=378272 RepID=A0ACB8TYA7_9APHY|nr:hypothetical protein BDY19DRAFT_907898 [Irpex rosettiformis]
MIIDELRHDRASLRSCALTARGWLHRSRTHLHRVFILQHNDFTFQSDKAEARYATIQREIPVILQYADQLDLQGVGSAPCGDYGRGSPIWSLLSLVRHVRTLRIIDTDLASVSLLCLQNPGSRSWTFLFPGLQILDIVRTSFQNPYDIFNLVCSFRQLRSFSIDDAGAISVASALPQPTFITFGPKVIRILNSHKMQGLVAALTAHLASSEEARETLQKLHIDSNLTTEASSVLQKLVKVVENTLPELHISLQEQCLTPHRISNMRAVDIRRAVQCISECTKLHVLHISVQRNIIMKMIQMVDGYDADVLCSPWQIYREALEGLNNTSFSCRELQFSFDVRDISGPCIASFENTILKSYLKRIDAVRFLVKNFVDPMDEPMRLRRLWSAGFQELRLRCTVYVEFCDRNDLTWL